MSSHALGYPSEASAAVPVAEVLALYPAARESTINNGMRIVTECTGGETATIAVSIDAGSRYEWENENGLAHFVEHMLFKGTVNRSRIQLEKEIEAMGGQLNAYTTRESTVFYAKVAKNDVPKAVEILGDILCNSTFNQNAIDAERETILRELEDVSSNLQEVVMDELHGMAYKNQPIGRSILGTAYDIKNINKAEIEQYVRAHFFGPRMVISGAGAVDHDQIVSLAEKSFSAIPIESDSMVPVVKGSAYFLGSMVRLREDDMPFCHIAYAYETAGWNDPDVFPLLCYQMMVESYTHGSTAAAYSASEQIVDVALNHLAESMTPFNTLYSDTGLFGMYMVTDAMTGYEGPRILCDHFLRPTYDCSPEKLEEAKNKLKMALFSQLDGTTATAEEIGRQVITTGRRMHPLETLQRIDEVDVVAINRVGKRFIYDADPVVAAMGPVFEVQPYEWWRRRSFTHRQ